MTTSILLRSPSPSPSPASTPLPALQSDLSSSSSSSSSSASGSCLDLHRSSAPSTRRIRFAPLPDPRRDLLFELHDPTSDDPKMDPKSPPQTSLNDLPDSVVVVSPSISPVSSLSSARSTPTIRISNAPSSKSTSKLLRPFSFLRRSPSPGQSPLSQSTSLPASRNISSLASSSTSLPNSPSSLSKRLPRFSTEDILTLGTKSLFRSRSGSTSSTLPRRPSSPSPRSFDTSKSLHRSASTGSGPGMKLDSGKNVLGEGSSQSHSAAAIAGSGSKRRRASSALTPGAGGGRHSSVKMALNDSRPSTAPSSSSPFPIRHVKMLNGRVYGSKRYAAQTLANPFANVRHDPEFVEWGYGGMGSVHASAGIANDMWKGLQRSERGGALFAGSSFGSSSESAHSSAGPVSVGGGRGGSARTAFPIAHRKMSDNVPECGMGNVGSVGDEDDGSGMAWVKRRRAEKEAKARLEQAAKEKSPEGRKSGDSMDASMYASTLSTACASAASTDITTPATSPLASRSPSLVDLNLTSSPLESHNFPEATRSAASEKPPRSDSTSQRASPSKEDHEHHILTAVRLSPNISHLSHKRSHPVIHGRTPSLPLTLSQIDKDVDNESMEQAPLSPVDTEETTASTSSLADDDEEPNRGSDDGDTEDDEEVQDIQRKTALGAGVEKISRHVDAEAR